MVQARAISNLTGLQNLDKKLGAAVDELKRNVLTRMATTIVEASPVDSGYYVRNHTLALRSGSFRATQTRPDSAPRRTKGDPVDVAAAKAAGLSKLMGEIGAINIKSNNFVFRNPMLYANLVEGLRGAYAQARRDMTSVVREEVQKLSQRLE